MPVKSRSFVIIAPKIAYTRKCKQTNKVETKQNKKKHFTGMNDCK